MFAGCPGNEAEAKFLVSKLLMFACCCPSGNEAETNFLVFACCPANEAEASLTRVVKSIVMVGTGAGELFPFTPPTCPRGG